MFLDFKRTFAASCMTLIMLGHGPIPSAMAADRDDHSYLPPFMRNDPATLVKADQRADAGQPPSHGGQPGKPEGENAPKAKTGFGGYLRNLFRRTLRFAWGD
jgi:hypothetical protein